MYKTHIYNSQSVSIETILYEAVLDSDSNSFSTSNVVLNSSGQSFIVSADALDSDENPFTVFA